MRRARLAIGACVALSTLPLPAQEVLKPFRATDDTPVMRAIPVDPPRAVPVDPADPSAGAVPAATPIPVPRGTPPPAKRGKNRPEPAATPSLRPGPVVAPVAPPEPTDPGEIRMTPNTGARTPEQAQLQVADSFYARKMYDVAAPEYQRYLDQFPTADDIPSALFRLGECYRHLGSLNSAKSVYDSLLTRFQTSEFAGPAAYRMADLYYQEKNYPAALPYYRKAAERLKEPAIMNAARFYAARCLEAGGGAANKLDARDLYRELASSDRNTNPFADASRLSFSLLLRDGDFTAEALKNILLLAKQTENPDLKAEATVLAGQWELDLKEPAKAAEEFKKALEMPSIGRWKEIAEVGLLRMNYDSGKYQQVLDYFAQVSADISPEQLPEVLLLCANSQRQLEHFAEALPAYDRILKDYPNTPYSREAAYQRLVCLYNADDAKLVAEIDAYLASAPEPAKRDQAMLMKAESLYKKSDFANAAPVYATVVTSSQLTGVLKAEALFKLGWCYMQVRDFEDGRKAFTQFIDENPTSKKLCAAHVQRAIALQSSKNLSGAEKDYLEVIKRYPACPERELALEQEAGIRGQANDNAGMADYFQQLLHDYPKSPAAAQANYWIGRTAFENKDYKKAAEHLTEARTLDKEQFFERATLALMLDYYYLEDRASVASEVDLYLTGGKQKVPAEVLRWLCEQLFDGKDFAKAEKYLQLLSERDDVSPRDLLKLGQSRLELHKCPEAAPVLVRYLESVHEPATRAVGLLELCRAQTCLKDYAGAQKSVDEALNLQPEGKLSGEARILAGDIEAAQANWEAAAKIYASVALIVDDDDVTPRALKKAAEAYQKAGRDTDSKKMMNTLQSRYPEYLQQKKTP